MHAGKTCTEAGLCVFANSDQYGYCENPEFRTTVGFAPVIQGGGAQYRASGGIQRASGLRYSARQTMHADEDVFAEKVDQALQRILSVSAPTHAQGQNQALLRQSYSRDGDDITTVPLDGPKLSTVRESFRDSSTPIQNKESAERHLNGPESQTGNNNRANSVISPRRTGRQTQPFRAASVAAGNNRASREPSRLVRMADSDPKPAKVVPSHEEPLQQVGNTARTSANSPRNQAYARGSIFGLNENVAAGQSESKPQRRSTFKDALHSAIHSLRSSKVTSKVPSDTESLTNMDLTSDKTYFAKLTEGLKQLDDFSHDVTDKIRSSVGEMLNPTTPRTDPDTLSQVTASSKPISRNGESAKSARAPETLNSSALQATVPQAPPPPPHPTESKDLLGNGKRRKKKRTADEKSKGKARLKKPSEQPRRPSKVEEISARMNEAEERAPFNVGDRMSLTNRFRPGYESTNAQWDDGTQFGTIEPNASDDEDYKMTARRFSRRYAR